MENNKRELNINLAGMSIEDIDTYEDLQEKISPQGYEPTKKGIAYKVFKVKNGKLYPPMVANPGGQDTPIGVWLDAEEGEFAGLSKTGRPQVKSTGSGNLSYRPGWHLGDIPRAKQFDRLNKETGEYEFPKDFVWAECEYAMDVDYQPESDARGYERTKIDKDGNVITYKSNKYQHSLAGVPHLPTNGYYKYRTNPNPDTVPWVITGQMKVNRILSDEEVNKILQDKGIPPIHRQGGDKTLKELGLQEGYNKKFGYVKQSKLVEDYHKEKESILQDVDDTFGQTEVYNWSTFILPNGHFLNPDTPKGKEYFEDTDQEPEYEHSDFIYYEYNPYGEDLFNDCVKINVTFPYLGIPVHPTSQQYSAIQRFLDEHQYECDTTYDIWKDYMEEDVMSYPEFTEMREPLLVLSPIGCKAYDMSYTSGSDVVKSIKKSFVSGVLAESKEDIDKFIAWAGDELAQRFNAQKNRLRGNERDIYYWMGKDKKDLEDRLNEIENIKTRKQSNNYAKQGADKVYEDSNWLVLKINTYEASVKYGKNTEWCISGYDGSEYFDDFSDSDIYFFIDKKNKLKYAFIQGDNIGTNNYEIWDENDFMTSYIPNAPKIEGLPDISQLNPQIKQELEQLYGKNVTNIESIVGNPELRELDDFFIDLDTREEYKVTLIDNSIKYCYNNSNEYVDCTDELNAWAQEMLEESLNEAPEKHNELNPSLFDGTSMRPEVRNKLLEIAGYFISKAKEDGVEFDIKDILLVGSNANYNYTKDSDVDLHIVVSKKPDCNKEHLGLIYQAYKSMFNNKFDCTIYGIPVEIYVEFEDDEVIEQPSDETILDESNLTPTTPYMLRNDGKLLTCGSFHPYIKTTQNQSLSSVQGELAKNPQRIKWFKEHSKLDETKLLCDKCLSGEITEEEIDRLNDLTNQEFCRARTSNFKVKVGGDNGEIYFRISSKDFNWFDLIWKVVFEHRNSIKDVTVVKDTQSLGGKEFNYYTINGKPLSHIDTEEFLTLKGNPVLESED